MTDAEVLHEILRRYVATDRRDAIGPASDALLGVVDEVFPVECADVEGARRLVLQHAVRTADGASRPLACRRANAVWPPRPRGGWPAAICAAACRAACRRTGPRPSTGAIRWSC